MAFPLAALAVMALGTAARVGANLYKQENNRQVYRNEEKASQALYEGYDRYLSQHGLSQNPNRAWHSYYGSAEKARANIRSSYADSVGSIGGGLTGFGGIGGTAAKTLYDTASLNRIYNRL